MTQDMSSHVHHKLLDVRLIFLMRALPGIFHIFDEIKDNIRSGLLLHTDLLRVDIRQS